MLSSLTWGIKHCPVRHHRLQVWERFQGNSTCLATSPSDLSWKDLSLKRLRLRGCYPLLRGVNKKVEYSLWHTHHCGKRGEVAN
jgi:hypothetical protein